MTTTAEHHEEIVKLAHELVTTFRDEYDLGVTLEDFAERDMGHLPDDDFVDLLEAARHIDDVRSYQFAFNRTPAWAWSWAR